MNVIDTNIWIYCHDKRDAEKQRKALALIERARPLALPWQVGCEFLAAARKLEPCGFTRQDAWAALRDMQAMAEVLLLPTTDLWERTETLQEDHQLHFWDALIIAACLQGNVRSLYSEDLPGNTRYGALEICNPFNLP